MEFNIPSNLSLSCISHSLSLSLSFSLLFIHSCFVFRYTILKRIDGINHFIKFPSTLCSFLTLPCLPCRDYIFLSQLDDGEHQYFPTAACQSFPKQCQFRFPFVLFTINGFPTLMLSLLLLLVVVAVDVHIDICTPADKIKASLENSHPRSALQSIIIFPFFSSFC